jgi:hypothetical protein
MERQILVPETNPMTNHQNRKRFKKAPPMGLFCPENRFVRIVSEENRVF